MGHVPVITRPNFTRSLFGIPIARDVIPARRARFSHIIFAGQLVPRHFRPGAVERIRGRVRVIVGFDLVLNQLGCARQVVRKNANLPDTRR